MRHTVCYVLMMTSHSDNTPAVTSPCIGVCRIDGRYCAGCWRTLQEIGAWSSLSNPERAAIAEQLPARRAAAGQAA